MEKHIDERRTVEVRVRRRNATTETVTDVEEIGRRRGEDRRC